MLRSLRVASAVLLGVMLLAAPALAQTDSILAQMDKEQSIHRPVTPEELERLKRQITEDTRSSIEGLGLFHYESGNLNERLYFFRAGAGLDYRWRPSTRFYVNLVETRYLTQDADYNGWGTNLTFGLASALTDAVRIQAELGATYFSSTGTANVNGLASVSYSPTDPLRLYVTASRTYVEESLLSATGLRPRTGPFADDLVGQVMETKGVAGVTYKLPLGFDVFAEGGGGVRNGHHVPVNPFGQARGIAGYNAISGPPEKPLSYLRLSYQLNYFGFADDRSGFGGASMLTADGQQTIRPEFLGSDGISPNPTANNPGVGGYFSPSYFVSNILRVDLAGRLIDPLTYRVSAFGGIQNYTDTATQGAFGFAALVDYALTDRVSVPASFVFDNLGPFNQLTVMVKLVIKL
jgi:cellulose synthase operon protein C